LLAYHRLVAGNPVHAIYAEGDLLPEFAKKTEFNAVQAQQVKDLGADTITAKKDALPSAEERKKPRPVINFNTLFRTYNIYLFRLSQSRVRSRVSRNLVVD
jgi:hypothetical protein